MGNTLPNEIVQCGEGRVLQKASCGLSINKGRCNKDGERLFTKACSDTTRVNGLQPKEGKFRLDIRKKQFIMRILRHWNRFPSSGRCGCSIIRSVQGLTGA